MHAERCYRKLLDLKSLGVLAVSMDSRRMLVQMADFLMLLKVVTTCETFSTEWGGFCYR
jgi:hypothetical protein